MKAVFKNELSRGQDGLLVGGSNYGFDQLLGRIPRDVDRADVGGEAYHEHLGVKVGHAINQNSALHQLQQVGRTRLTG
ncbi:MAG: hypothetical protein WC655_03950 [Candidatus Hydrogenedentales bacterium]